MAAPFDERLRRVLKIKGTDELVSQTPFSNYTEGYNIDSVNNSYIMSPYSLNSGKDDKGKIVPQTDYIKKKQAKQTEAWAAMQNDPRYLGNASIMNPYAFTRLYGAYGGKYLVDTSLNRKWYEIDGDSSGHYAKNPTTANIIKWGSMDGYGRYVYSYQDFVFCKHWNVIPNNRLITLRRFAQPTYDNLNFPGMENGTSGITSHPIATAVTYFGDGTGNKLSDLLSFTAGLNWEPAKAEVWEVSSKAQPISRVESATGWDKIFSSGVSSMATILGLVGKYTDEGNENYDFNAPKGLPDDPYSGGPYDNRVLGPINRIDSTYKRAPGMKFNMDNLKITFKYTARPIGGINTKAVLLDLISNFLVMGYASAVFWGGSHRFMISPEAYPFTDDKARSALWEGKLFGEEGAAHILVNTYRNKMAKGLDDKTSVGNIFSALGSMASKLMGDLLGSFGLSDAANYLNGKATNESGVNGAKNVEKMIAGSIQEKVGQVPFLNGMKSILTGMPVGDWHLVIGNPMNPVATIGNLICEDISIKLGEELGPDDFPLEFTATVTLKHAMARDRDGIEAMFNRGMGRIYELPDKYSSSADGQSIVDNKTNTTGSGAFNWTSVPKMPTGSSWSTTGYTDNVKGPFKDAYTVKGNDISYIPDTLNMNDNFYNSDMQSVVHHIMPWQTKIIL